MVRRASGLRPIGLGHWRTAHPRKPFHPQPPHCPARSHAHTYILRLYFFLKPRFYLNEGMKKFALSRQMFYKICTYSNTDKKY
jgi:hypothetical protein